MKNQGIDSNSNILNAKKSYPLAINISATARETLSPSHYSSSGAFGRTTTSSFLDGPISSFDKDKKFAILDRIFLPQNSFETKTVLWLTHDMEPLIDTAKPSKNAPLSHSLTLDLKRDSQ